MRVSTPLLDGLELRPQLRYLVLNHAIVAAHKAGNTIQVPHGAKIKNVSVAWLLAEHAVLEAGEMRRPDVVSEQMERMLEKCSAAKGSAGTRAKGKTSASRAVCYAMVCRACSASNSIWKMRMMRMGCTNHTPRRR